MAISSGRREGSSAQPQRTSTISADYLNTTQLFLQTKDSQTQDLTGDTFAEEQRIQAAFVSATERLKSGRRVTFSKVVNEEARTPEEGDEVDGTDRVSAGGKGDDELDSTSAVIRDILANLDQGAAQFAAEVTTRPNYVYNLIGKLCAQLYWLKEQYDLLHQSNTINRAKRDQLATAYSSVQGRL
jgi:hypothetical protein